jgi:hypothetical protein
LSAKFNGTKQDRYPVDPNLKTTGRLKSPPAGHVRRCQGTTQLGVQCGHWANIGYRFCQYHSARRGSNQRASKKAMGFYSKNIGEKLRKKLEGMAESAENRLKLYEEIDLARVLAQNAVQMYDLVVEQNSLDGKVPDPAVAAAKAQASQVMRDSLDHVASLVQTMVKIEKAEEGSVHIGNLKFMTDCVQRIIAEELGENQPLLAKKILGRVAEIAMLDNVAANKVILSVE